MTGSIQVAVGVVEGKVVAKWHDPVSEITFDPQNAYQIGLALAQAAMDAHNGSAVNAKPFLEGEVQKRKVTDQQRDMLIGIVATQLKTLIDKGRSPGIMAIHAVDAVLNEVSR